MSPFRRVVATFVSIYGVSEAVAAEVAIDLLRWRAFDWRKL